MKMYARGDQNGALRRGCPSSTFLVGCSGVTPVQPPRKAIQIRPAGLWTSQQVQRVERCLRKTMKNTYLKESSIASWFADYTQRQGGCWFHANSLLPTLTTYWVLAAPHLSSLQPGQLPIPTFWFHPFVLEFRCPLFQLFRTFQRFGALHSVPSAWNCFPQFPTEYPSFPAKPFFSFPWESSSFMDEDGIHGSNGNASGVLGWSGSFALEHRGYREFRLRPIPRENSYGIAESIMKQEAQMWTTKS